MKELKNIAVSLFKEAPNNISLLANASAFIMENFDHLNWVGFYLYDNNESLLLGPFQGRVACEIIKVGSGVCGTSFIKNKILNVPNVNDFKGHISCDVNSKSELVFPLVKNNVKIGVLDIDSFLYNRFDQNIINKIKEIVEVLLDTFKI